MRARVCALIGAAIIVASCGSPNVTPYASSSATPTSTGSPGAVASPIPTVGASTPLPTAGAPGATPRGTRTAALSGRWEPAGAMDIGRLAPRAVLLDDGGVMVVGHDEAYSSCVRADSVKSEVWTPGTGDWSAGPSLNKPRADFVAVLVAGGSALVTGGVNAGTKTEFDQQDDHQSYSSTYVFDPAHAGAGWTRMGLLGRARTSPIAAPLPDGRVLVTGGYYLSGSESGSVSEIDLVVYRPDTFAATPSVPPLADIDPPAMVPTLATAELFDPAKGSWSATGAMRYARVDAPAATLTDGRVLVVGSTPGGDMWNYTQPAVDGRAYRTAEIFDPGAGRWSLTGELPAIDWSPLAKFGPYPISSTEVTDPGSLVALADGGALLVGQATSWSIWPLEMDGTVIRTLRFDPATANWAAVDVGMYWIGSDDNDNAVLTETIVDGHSRNGAVVAGLDDGHVLIAGGYEIVGGKSTSAVDLYDPAADRWSTLPAMPQPRADGTAVVIDDGSVLVLGGADPTVEPASFMGCGIGPTGLASAVRFIPEP